MPLQAASSLHQEAYHTLPPQPSKVKSRTQVGGGGEARGWGQGPGLGGGTPKSRWQAGAPSAALLSPCASQVPAQ